MIITLIIISAINMMFLAKNIKAHYKETLQDTVDDYEEEV
jgi:hypothetical protein